jgi:AcrR family transcriptional regulator
MPRTPSQFRRLQPHTLTSRQAELLGAIEALYLAEGFAGQTLDALATTLRCSKMTLYTLAQSREQLAVAVFRRFFEETAAEADRLVKARRSPVERVDAHVDVVAQRMLQMSAVCFHELISFDPTREVYESFARDSAVALVGLLEGAPGPNARRLSAGFVAETVKLVLESMCSGEFTTDTGIDVDDGVAQLRNLAKLTVAKPKSPT